MGIDGQLFCVHQLFQGERRVRLPGINPPGWGDCSVCRHDPANNSYCRGYAPVTFWLVEVREPEILNTESFKEELLVALPD